MKNYIRKINLILRLDWITCGQRLLQLLKLKGSRKYCSYIEEREIFFFFFLHGLVKQSTSTREALESYIFSVHSSLFYVQKFQLNLKNAKNYIFTWDNGNLKFNLICPN